MQRGVRRRGETDLLQGEHASRDASDSEEETERPFAKRARLEPAALGEGSTVGTCEGVMSAMTAMSADRSAQTTSQRASTDNTNHSADSDMDADSDVDIATCECNGMCECGGMSACRRGCVRSGALSMCQIQRRARVEADRQSRAVAGRGGTGDSGFVMDALDVATR